MYWCCGRRCLFPGQAKVFKALLCLEQHVANRKGGTFACGLCFQAGRTLKVTTREGLFESRLGCVQVESFTNSSIFIHGRING